MEGETSAEWSSLVLQMFVISCDFVVEFQLGLLSG